MPHAPIDGPGAGERALGRRMLASRCRCPRCGYDVSGQPGAPARAYGPFTADARCPECALEIPEGSLCIVGGASGRVVDPNGALSAWAGMAAAFGALALIPLAAWTSMLIAAPRLAHAANACAAVAALGIVVVGGWFLWRHWRPVRSSGPAERAGARLRRAMVVRGGLHLWSGEPGLDAQPRSVAGGDVREVRGERRIPLFRRAGAGEAAAIHFVTPVSFWSMHGHVGEAVRAGLSVADGMVWVALPPGVQVTDVARDVMRTLRAPPVRPPVALLGAPLHSAPTPTARGDPNRLEVPAAVTAATAAKPPACPRCAAHLATDAESGAWWEPLAAEVACPSCGLRVAAGAVVASGFRDEPDNVAWRAGTRRVTWVPAARPRARFQPCSETWIVEPGRLRVFVRRPGWTGTRGKATELVIPSRGTARFAIGSAPNVGRTSDPPQLDVLFVRGTAPELGPLGERALHLTLPAGVQGAMVVDALSAAMHP